MDGSKITPSILGLRSSGSCVSSRVISGCICNWCLSGVKSVTVDFGAEIKSELSFRYMLNISRLIGNLGLQLRNLWSSSPDCGVVSVANPLDRWRRPLHISYIIVE